MGRDLVAGEKLGHLVGEGVAVVLKQFVTLCTVMGEETDRESCFSETLSDACSISICSFCKNKKT